MEVSKLSKVNKALCLSSAGPKGMVILGQLHKIRNEIPLFSKFIGSSIGAVINTMLIFGYTPREIFDEVKHNPANLRKINLKFYKTFSLFDIDPFMRKIANMLTRKLKNFNLKRIPTLRDLYYITGKELVIVTVNATKRKIVYLSYKTHPNLYVDMAIRMSIGVPIAFQTYKYKGCYYIDPGWNLPFPIKYFDDGKTYVIGITIKTKFEVRDSFIAYIEDLCYTSVEINMRRQIELCSEKCEVIMIPVYLTKKKSINVTSPLSKDHKEELFKIGYEFN